MKRIQTKFWFFCILLFLFHPDIKAQSVPYKNDYAFGLDVSFVKQKEDSGEKYYDVDASQKSALQIFRDHGFNWARIMICNEPVSDRLTQALAYAIQAAKDVRKYDYHFVLDMMFSNGWANPMKQPVPVLWANMSHQQRTKAVYEYIYHVLSALKKEGVFPEIVQIGNEISNGFLWPAGRVYFGNDDDSEWEQFTDYLKAGIDAVHNVEAPGHKVKVMLHVDHGGDVELSQTFFDKMKEFKVDYDVIGYSFYPWSHGTLLDLRDNLSMTALRYGKEIFVIETGYYWRQSDYFKNIAPPFLETPDGQRDWFEAVNEVVMETPNGLGRGVFWWEPMFSGRGFFDDESNVAKPIVKAFEKYSFPMKRADGQSRIYKSESNKKTPIMGWSSWNNFRVNIDEQMIKEQADAMIASGLYDAGYRFINIDDGYFGGRDSTGKLFVDRSKFPSGMESLVEYIHGKGLKAGIYTDAGQNTCGSIWDNDKNGIGVGIYGHLADDCNLFFREWRFDFLKVDWCGGEKMGLDEETEYTQIIDGVKAIDDDIVFNICRWQFPGEWAIMKADSWRISGDIQAKFSSILSIIDLNADLAKYASPGHYNDMDMLQVGRGMSYDEDKTHFSMWCMLNSPLLAGNDLRSMSEQTIEILTNKEIIALNQDSGFKQATRLFSEDQVDVWVKPLGKEGRSKAIAIMNRGEGEVDFKLDAARLEIDKNTTIRDLWKHEDLGTIGEERDFKIPAHGIVVLKEKL